MDFFLSLCFYAKSESNGTCGMLSLGFFCGANTFVYHFSGWLETGAWASFRESLHLMAFICRSDLGSTDSHFSLKYTHMQKYMLTLTLWSHVISCQCPASNCPLPSLFTGSSSLYFFFLQNLLSKSSYSLACKCEAYHFLCCRPRRM